MEVLAKKECDLIAPYGGKLVNLVVEGEERARLVEHANTLPSIQLTARSLCDIELLKTCMLKREDARSKGSPE
jgi:ATP sulfurylase